MFNVWLGAAISAYLICIISRLSRLKLLRGRSGKRERNCLVPSVVFSLQSHPVRDIVTVKATGKSLRRSPGHSRRVVALHRGLHPRIVLQRNSNAYITAATILLKFSGSNLIDSAHNDAPEWSGQWLQRVAAPKHVRHPKQSSLRAESARCTSRREIEREREKGEESFVHLLLLYSVRNRNVQMLYRLSLSFFSSLTLFFFFFHFFIPRSRTEISIPFARPRRPSFRSARLNRSRSLFSGTRRGSLSAFFRDLALNKDGRTSMPDRCFFNAECTLRAKVRRAP